MKIIKGRRHELERELLKAMLTHGAEKRAARLKQRLERRGRGRLVLASDSARDAVPPDEAASDGES